MKNLQENWEKTLELLKSELPPVSFETWISPLAAKKADLSKKILYVECGEPFITDILQKRYLSLLENAVKTIFNETYKINFIDSFHEKNQKKTEEPDFDEEFYFNPRYSFDNFVVGGTNQYANAVALAVAETPCKMYNPLFIYGGSGLGKTHLMHAIGHYILENHKKLKVLYVSSEMFTNELIMALKDKNKIRNFKKKYRNIDVLLIDDIQFIEKKEATQEEFFHTFNTLYDLNKQIIISSDRAPNKLTNLDERLRSRFSWNIIADIQPPDYETRVAILMKKAEIENVEISEDLRSVINLIAEKIKYNIRELEGAFSRIISFSFLMNKPITVSFAKENLKDIVSSGDLIINTENIKRAVCKYYNITIKDIESSKKIRSLAFPRQVAMFLCRELTSSSLPKIGGSFGGRDHTTVLHACQKIKKEVFSDENVSNDIETLKEIINES